MEESHEPMKILQVNAVNGVRSTGRTVSELAVGLERRGHSCRIAYSTGLPTPNGYVIGTPAEKLLHSVASRVSGRQAYFSGSGTRAFLRLVDAEAPDVLHLHNLHSNYINFPMLLAHLARRDIAVALTLHDCWYYTGKCCYYTSDNCARWQSGCGACPRLAEDNPSWFFDATAAMWADKRRLYADLPRLGVIGVSDWIANEARCSILSDASIIRRIYNWVDLNVFTPVPDSGATAREFPSEEFIILGVASPWSARKGLDDFMRLSRMLESGVLDRQVSSGPGRPLVKPRVVLVGELPGRMLPAGITHLRPTTDVRRLAKLYRSADVLLQLSKEETFGKVVAEALACGTPAIAYNSTANPELIGPGCGYVVDPGSLDQVVDRIASIARMPRGAYRAASRAFAARTFDKDMLIDSHVEFYRDLRGASVPRPGGSHGDARLRYSERGGML